MADPVPDTVLDIYTDPLLEGDDDGAYLPKGVYCIRGFILNQTLLQIKEISPHIHHHDIHLKIYKLVICKPIDEYDGKYTTKWPIIHWCTCRWLNAIHRVIESELPLHSWKFIWNRRMQKVDHFIGLSVLNDFLLWLSLVILCDCAIIM